MAKKSMKEAAMKGTSVFETIARGADGVSAQDTKGVPGVQDAKNISDVRGTIDVPQVLGKPQLERLNLKIPADLKAYLQAAAYRESSPTHTVSLTEYLCNLVRADMEKHTGE